MYPLADALLAIIAETLIWIDTDIPWLLVDSLLMGIFDASILLMMAKQVLLSGDRLAPKVGLTRLVVAITVLQVHFQWVINIISVAKHKVIKDFRLAIKCGAAQTLG